MPPKSISQQIAESIEGTESPAHEKAETNLHEEAESQAISELLGGIESKDMQRVRDALKSFWDINRGE